MPRAMAPDVWVDACCSCCCIGPSRPPPLVRSSRPFACCAAPTAPQSGHDISDLGETLYTFLLRYGEELDYTNQAVG